MGEQFWLKGYAMQFVSGRISCFGNKLFGKPWELVKPEMHSSSALKSLVQRTGSGGSIPK